MKCAICQREIVRMSIGICTTCGDAYARAVRHTHDGTTAFDLTWAGARAYAKGFAAGRRAERARRRVR